MPRQSPLGIDGTGLSFRDPDEHGRMTVAMARAKDEAGRWQTKRFPVASWRRDGSPVIPDEAKKWARDTRKDFIKGVAVAQATSFQDFADLLVDMKDGTVSPHRLTLIRHVATGLAAAGVKNMQAENFAVKVRGWIAGLNAGWSFAPGAPNRPRTARPLSNTTRNKLLIITKQVTALAVRKRRLAFDPLEDIHPWPEDSKQKTIFTVEELRHMVSDTARYGTRRQQEALEREIAVYQQDGTSRTEAIKAIAKAQGKHWTSLYNLLARDDETDSWWLPCCVLAYTGARVDEAMHLRWEWFDWKAGLIHLRLADDYQSKSDSKRLIPLEPELREILHPLAKPAGHLFTGHIRQGGSGKRARQGAKGGSKDYTGALRRYLKRIGIDPKDRAGPCPVASVRESYEDYCRHEGLLPLGGKRFSAALEAKGLVYVRKTAGRYWHHPSLSMAP